MGTMVRHALEEDRAARFQYAYQSQDEGVSAKYKGASLFPPAHSARGPRHFTKFLLNVTHLNGHNMKLAITATLLGASLAQASGEGATGKWQAPGPDDCKLYPRGTSPRYQRLT